MIHCSALALLARGTLPLLLLVCLGGAGCNTGSRTDSTGPADWLEWQAKRREAIAGSNGWTTLVVRHWLPEGATSAGSDATNHLVLPPGRAPACIGWFIRTGQTVRFEAAPGVVATVDGHPLPRAELLSDVSNTPTRLSIGPLTFVVIERGHRLGVRVRDPEAKTRLNFKGLSYFPYDRAWRLEGKFEAFVSARKMRVQDILGGTQELVSPGRLVLSHSGADYRLDVVEEPGEADYFVLFRDQTAGRSTYGSGRFLYVKRPGLDGRVVVDFNRAYTPPCAFTAFATCPLPPRQNWLPFPVRAGERKPAHH